MDNQPPTNMATSALLNALKNIKDSTDGIADTLQRYESRQSPGLFRIHPEPFQTSQRLRSTLLTIESGATSSLTHAAGIRVMAGSSIVATLRVAINHNEYVLPVTWDRGLDIRLIDVATGIAPLEILDAWLTAYTE